MTKEEELAIEHMRQAKYYAINNKEIYIDRRNSKIFIKDIDILLNSLEKKDKIIKELIDIIVKLRENSEEDCFIDRKYRNINECIKTTCESCIKEYVTNKIEAEGKVE